ncbi:MAG TPA: Holliday junction resolvase RuvX [Gammaproteobacteria bacterium]|nr:Holliday junction resolvase RuvX [Gammaproteobacteria bacterium]
MLENGCVLGFDYGTRRIGVAVGDTLTRTARPLTTIASRNGRPDWEAVQKVLEEWRPHTLLVGLPLHMDGAPQPMTSAARRFANRLRERFRLPVEHVDERLSSREAEQILDETVGRGRYDRETIDQLAAQLILQSWLDGIHEQSR